jgi:hypothetical protein
MTLRSLFNSRKEAKRYRKRHAGKEPHSEGSKGVRASPNEAMRSSFCGALRMLTLWLTSNINMKWLTPFVARALSCKAVPVRGVSDHFPAILTIALE